MNACIKLEGEITEEDCYELKQLAHLIEKECDVYVKPEQQATQHGVKDSGLMIGMTIAGLALSGIQTGTPSKKKFTRKKNIHYLYTLIIRLLNLTI